MPVKIVRILKVERERERKKKKKQLRKGKKDGMLLDYHLVFKYTKSK